MPNTLSHHAVYVVIVAGGKGARMGMALAKQFLPLQGKPILYHTINAFVKAIPDAQIRLVLPEDELSKLNMVLQHFEERIHIEVFSGGNNRFESVRNGLNGIPDHSIVLVHDGVRPFVSEELIKRCITSCASQGSAVPCTPVIESIRSLDGEKSQPVNRDTLRNIQTPQVFFSETLKAAFTQAYQEGFTDEASVVEHNGQPVHLVEGERFNIKITTPEDLILAECIAANALK